MEKQKSSVCIPTYDYIHSVEARGSNLCVLNGPKYVDKQGEHVIFSPSTLYPSIFCTIDRKIKCYALNQ